MRAWRISSLALGVALTGLLAPPAAFAQGLPATPPNYVVDLANVVGSATEQELNRLLKDLESQTTAQLIVLTVRTTGGEDIDKYANDVFARWRLGHRGQDNGVLIVVAVGDRKVRIEVGYGLEDTLRDADAIRIINEVFKPRFRAGDISGGIREGTLLAANMIARRYNATISDLPSRSLSEPRQQSSRRGQIILPGAPGDGGCSCCGTLLVLLIVLLVISAFARRRRYGGWYGRRYGGYGRRRGFGLGDALLWYWLLGGGRRGGGWGGGGWGGGLGGGGFGGGGRGGFGGFGGGGGGRSGGGGASGGW